MDKNKWYTDVDTFYWVSMNLLWFSWEILDEHYTTKKPTASVWTMSLSTFNIYIYPVLSMYQFNSSYGCAWDPENKNYRAICDDSYGKNWNMSFRFNAFIVFLSITHVCHSVSDRFLWDFDSTWNKKINRYGWCILCFWSRELCLYGRYFQHILLRLNPKVSKNDKIGKKSSTAKGPKVLF